MTTRCGATSADLPGPWCLLRNGAIFFAALFLAGWAIGRRLPFPDVPDIAARHRYFAENRDRFDTIFIGSSRIRHQIIPRDFDAETNAGGLATHSLNLGYSGMWPPESFYFLRRLLALRPLNLKWVVIELMDYRFTQVDEEPPTSRVAYWHDPRHTAMACRMVIESPCSATERVRLLVRHLWLGAKQLTNPGRGAEWLHGRYFSERKKRHPRWVERGGFDPEPETEGWNDAARADFARQVEAVRGSLPEVRVRAGFAQDLRGIIAEVRRAGAEPVFIIPPSVRPEENLTRGLPDGLTVFAFNRPDEYPRLYLPETHYDPGHLNEQGAREFSRLVARRLVEHARGR